jgi:selenocysteine lyase/cysteine desulfurase
MTLLAPLPIETAIDAFVVAEKQLYLDCAAHGPPLRSVRLAATAALNDAGAPWFGAAWRERVERVRALAAQLFDRDADTVALVPSAAYGLSVAARNLPLLRGEAVLVLDGQFPSNLLPWQRRCVEAGARLVVARRDAKHDWTAAVLRALDEEPGIATLALPHVHWQDGTLLDLSAIALSARRCGARLVLDLSQSLGALPVDLDAWRPDFVVAVGYKWLLGPYGLAYLWAAPRWRETGTPLEHGWMACDTDAMWRTNGSGGGEPLPGARRFDAGGVCDLVRLAMSEAALMQVLEWGVVDIAEALRVRVRALVDTLRARGLGAWLPTGEIAHFCALQPPVGYSEVLATALRAEQVVFTLHHERLRIAPHLHVAIAQLETLADRIADIVSVTSRGGA